MLFFVFAHVKYPSSFQDSHHNLQDESITKYNTAHIGFRSSTLVRLSLINQFNSSWLALWSFCQTTLFRPPLFRTLHTDVIHLLLSVRLWNFQYSPVVQCGLRRTWVDTLMFIALHRGTHSRESVLGIQCSTVLECHVSSNPSSIHVDDQYSRQIPPMKSRGSTTCQLPVEIILSSLIQSITWAHVQRYNYLCCDLHEYRVPVPSI
jgi:hypothetical protein